MAQKKDSTATGDWNAMNDEQKQQTFDSLPDKQKDGKTYYQWVKEGYHHQYENWMPWIEDKYLSWFTNDNKASYATKGEINKHGLVLFLELTAADTLDKSKVTGVEQVDKLQDGANNLVAGQVGKGGLLQPVGDMASKEGINRAERGGKDDKGSWLPGMSGKASSGQEAVQNSASGLWSSASDGAKQASSMVSSLWSGEKKAAA